MKLLVKPVVETTELERLYVALECGEFSCTCFSACQERRRFFGDEESEDILF